jgi:amino-acid N-acetyltransferase
MSTSTDTLDWFRSAAPYINAFQGQTFVIAFGGEVVSEGQFKTLSHDLNLLESLGVRLVLVHGARPQTEAQMQVLNLTPHYVNGVRVTDETALNCVLQASALVGYEIMAQLSVAISNSPMAGSDMRIASGNFVTARPLGIHNGVDFQRTGLVRKIDSVGIQRRLEDEEIVLLSPIGYSPTGEIFNLTLEEIATATAIALKAEKLIFLMNGQGVLDPDNKTISRLTVTEAQQLLQSPQKLNEDAQLFLPCAIRAISESVNKVHLIDRHQPDSLLQELFTDRGIGSMVVRDIHDVLRLATLEDAPALLQILEPLMNSGALVFRSMERLQQEITRFTLMCRGEEIIGCVALLPFAGETSGELACLAVHSRYQRAGRGDILLRHVEQLAQSLGLHRLFLLSTQTGQWFMERGFEPSSLERLPQSRQLLYNYERRSKVFVKTLFTPSTRTTS